MQELRRAKLSFSLGMTKICNERKMRDHLNTKAHHRKRQPLFWRY